METVAAKKTVVAIVAKWRFIGQIRDCLGITAGQDFTVFVNGAPARRISSAPARPSPIMMLVVSTLLFQCCWTR